MLRDDTKIADEAEDLLETEMKAPFVPLDLQGRVFNLVGSIENATDPFDWPAPYRAYGKEDLTTQGKAERFDALTDEEQRDTLATIVEAAGGELINVLESLENAVRILSGPYPQPRSGEFRVYADAVIALDKVVSSIIMPTPHIADRIRGGEKLW
jgi:hypothetical protein